MQRPEEFFISTDKALLDASRIHAFLSQSYWAKGISRDLVERSIQHSLCFGVYTLSREQVGFARVISDFTTFAYLCDVYIEPEYRGRGLSKLLMSTILSHPDLQGLRRFFLGTRDAHGLYRQFGFEVSTMPERWMEIVRKDPYGG